MTVVPARQRGRQAEDRDLVDRRGDVGRAELDGVQRRRADDEVGERLADAVVGPCGAVPAAPRCRRPSTAGCR
jgi:hypothetical protein